MSLDAPRLRDKRLRAASRQCYLTFALWPEVWLYIYPENFETRCLKSDARKYFPPLSDCAEMSSICQARLICSCNSALVRTRETCEPLRRSVWCYPNDPPKSSSVVFSVVFWRVGCLSEDLTWPTDSKTTPLRLKDQYPTISDDEISQTNIARIC